MFGLDEQLVELSDEGMVAFALILSFLLGLRHSTDPDHLAAITTLVASDEDRPTRTAGKLGIFWGLGHAVTLAAFGLPVLLFGGFLPSGAQQLAKTAIAVVIIVLAIRLILRWRQGAFHFHAHAHGEGIEHVHPHSHSRGADHEHAHSGDVTRALHAAFVVGLLHGLSGSAGVSVLVLASVETTRVAVFALLTLALGTGVSMWVITTIFGATLASKPLRSLFRVVAPALAVASLSFGVWYGTMAWQPI